MFVDFAHEIKDKLAFQDLVKNYSNSCMADMI